MDNTRAPNAAAGEWVRLTADALSLDAATSWASLPNCGAVVAFAGSVRDFSEGRPGVFELEYEAYREQVEPRLRAIAAEARRRWPALGRIALLHREGALGVGETAVVVAVSAPHRDDAFEVARWAIDTLKATAPIWKRERWAGGDDWGRCVHDGAAVAAGVGRS